MRIGTWNLEGRWGRRHRDLLARMDCDLLLLTEVSEQIDLPGYGVHFSQQAMAVGRRWAAIASTMPLSPETDPHGASAMAVVDGMRVCASVLPWRSCGIAPPWTGATTAEKTAAAVAAIEAAEPTIWGGDFNHALSGREWAGSVAGRRALLAAIERLGLQVPTALLPHRIDGLLSIDHIAVPKAWMVKSVEAVSAIVAGVAASDHDAYVVEIHA